MTACIGWPADPPCPVYGDFHGCAEPDGHPGSKRLHMCACGATTGPPKAQIGDHTNKRRAECGTRSGYSRHHDRKEPACPACRQAEAEASRRRRNRTP